MIIGCAQITSLGLKKHQFGLTPHKIVWIQIAGLTEEHLAMMKFSYPSIEQKSEFEKFVCMGKVWNYNLYDLRKSSFTGFQVQATGSKNIKGNCSDYERKSIYQYLTESNYKVAVYESHPTKKQSLSSASECKDKENDPLKGMLLWISSNQVIGEDKFHATDEELKASTGISYDKSCDKKICYSSFSENSISLYKKFTKNSKYFLFNLRDYSYENALRKRNYKLARNILIDIEKAIMYFKKVTDESDTLFLVTTTSPLGVEFPKSGYKWKQFEDSGKNANYRNDQLISTVWASGARSENFCGMYEESEILSRALSGSKQQGLEFVILNPFN